jgi:hypothetical protein
MAEFDPTNGTARAADVGPALKEEATKLADKSVSTGVEAAQAVGKAAENAAQALDEALPMLAGYVRNAAQYTNQFADSLRDKKAEELLATAATWARQQPLMTLAGAAVLGFALSRIAKSGIAGAVDGAANGSTANSSSASNSNTGTGGGADNAWTGGRNAG